MWNYLDALRREDGVSVFVTTHLLDEGDRADQVAILDQGNWSPMDRLGHCRPRSRDVLWKSEAQAPELLAAEIRQRFDVHVQSTANTVRLDTEEPQAWVAKLLAAYTGSH